MRIRIFKPLYCFFALFICQIALSQQSESLFAQIAFRESPYAEYVGIIPIDKSTASNIHHYQFTYDDKERPLEIQYMLGDRPYTGENIVDRFFFPSSKILFQYSSEQITLQFFDHNNQRVNVYGTVYEAIYSMNSDGEKTALHYYDREGNPTQTGSGIAHYEWTKGQEGMIVEKRMNLEGELQPLRPNFPFFETHMRYDERGMVTALYNFGKSAQLENNETGAAVDFVVYDDQGNFRGWRVEDKDGNPVAGNGARVAKGVNEHNEFGNDILLEFYNIDGSRMANYQGVGLARTTYNKHQQIIEQAVYTTDNKLVEEGIAVYAIEYDENGNRSKLSALGSDRKPISTPDFFGAAIQESTYNEQNNLIETRFYDQDGNLVSLEPLGGGSIIQYVYSGLQRTAAVILDKDRKEIQRIER